MQKLLILVGALILIAGVLWPWLSRIGFGRLPGDLAFDVSGGKLYIPIVTCLILSVAITLILRLFGR